MGFRLESSAQATPSLERRVFRRRARRKLRRLCNLYQAMKLAKRSVALGHQNSPIHNFLLSIRVSELALLILLDQNLDGGSTHIPVPLSTIAE